MLVTSNLDFASWTEIFGDPRLTAALLDRLTAALLDRLTAALLDRLTHRCHIMEFQGDSFRFKESLRRQEQASP